MLFFPVMFPILFLFACGEQPGSDPEANKQEIAEGTIKDQESMDISWGREISLDDMISMAKKGRIIEIQWHILPNILRAQTCNGEVFHIRNEDKGVDLQGALLKAGVEVGEEGVLFRHVF